MRRRVALVREADGNPVEGFVGTVRLPEQPLPGPRPMRPQGLTRISRAFHGAALDRFSEEG